MSESTEHGVTLSGAGEARRDAILGVLLGAQRARVRRRRAVRASALAAVVVFAAGAAYVGLAGTRWEGSPEPSDRSGDRSRQALADRSGDRSHRGLVETDPTIVSRVSIDDEELTRLLREAGRAEGVIRVGGRAMLESEVLAPAAQGGV